MSSKNQNNNNLFLDVSSYVVNYKTISTESLQHKFDIDKNTLDNIVFRMEQEGIVSPLLNNNQRDVLMTKDEFNMYFNVDDTNIDNKVINNKNSNVKKDNFFVKLLKFLLFLLLIYLLWRLLFVRIFITNSFVKKYKHNDETEMALGENIGWVKNGDNWNFYDLNGKKKFDCIIDDSGKYYYLDGNGNLALDRWVEFNGNTYYVNGDGELLRNQWVGDFYVGNDGSVLKNTITPDGYEVGGDGRYKPKPTTVQYTTMPTTTIPIETAAIIDPNSLLLNNGYPAYSIPEIIPEETINPIYNYNNVITPSPSDNYEILAPTAASYDTSEIIAPTAPADSIKEAVIPSAGYTNNVNNKYTIRTTNKYDERISLSNDKYCSIEILIPELVDKNGVVLEDFANGMFIEQENIVSELLDIAEASIEDIGDEDDDDDYYYSYTYSRYRYISSIIFQEARIKSQDEDSLTIREKGKCKFNNGKNANINLLIEYDKDNGSVSYYIEE